MNQDYVVYNSSLMARYRACKSHVNAEQKSMRWERTILKEIPALRSLNIFGSYFEHAYELSNFGPPALICVFFLRISGLKVDGEVPQIKPFGSLFLVPIFTGIYTYTRKG